MRPCAAGSCPPRPRTRSPGTSTSTRRAEQALEHRPNFNTAPTTDVFVVYEDGVHPPSGHVPLGPGAAVGQGPVGRQPDDQRPGRDGRDQAGVPPRLRQAALHRARRRLLRVEGRAGPEAQAAVSSSTAPTGSRTRSPGCGSSGGAPRPRPASPRTSQGEEVTVRSVTIITGAANEPMAAHPRPHAGHPRRRRPGPRGWTRTMHDTERLGQLLVPAPPELITFHPVSTDVNNVAQQGRAPGGRGRPGGGGRPAALGDVAAGVRPSGIGDVVAVAGGTRAARIRAAACVEGVRRRRRVGLGEARGPPRSRSGPGARGSGGPRGRR